RGPEARALRVGLEELGQAAEVAVDERLVGARLVRDRVDAHGGEAVARENAAHGVDQPLLRRLDVARTRGGLCGPCSHAENSVTGWWLVKASEGIEPQRRR